MAFEKQMLSEIKIDKYADKAIKFYDMQERYDLIFSSDFESADQTSIIYSDLLLDLKQADKTKELHIWINSQGGVCSTLILLMQQIQQFEYVVTIGTGQIDSCGFMLWCLGDERYLGKLTFCMYHAISSGSFGKANQMQQFGAFIEKYQSLFEQIVRSKGILNDEQLNKGKYTQMYFLGKQLIDRGVSFDFDNFKNRLKLQKIQAFKVFGDIYIKDNQNNYHLCHVENDFMNKKQLLLDYLKQQYSTEYDQFVENLGQQFLVFFENFIKIKSRLLKNGGFISNEQLQKSYSDMFQPIPLEQLKKKIKIFCKEYDISFKDNVKSEDKTGIKIKIK